MKEIEYIFKEVYKYNRKEVNMSKYRFIYVICSNLELCSPEEGINLVDFLIENNYIYNREGKNIELNTHYLKDENFDNIDLKFKELKEKIKEDPIEKPSNNLEKIVNKICKEYNKSKQDVISNINKYMMENDIDDPEKGAKEYFEKNY